MCYHIHFQDSLQTIISTPGNAEIVPATDPEVAFKDCDVAILVGAIPRREGMERKDLLTQNAKIFKGQGDCLNRQAKKSVKVSVRQDDGDLSALVALLNSTLPPIHYPSTN